MVEPSWINRRGIKASAGSGKTYSLATYYLGTFLRGASPAGLLATTFTRKAAGEILGRVLARLAAACEDPERLRKLSQDCHLDRELTSEEAQAHLKRLCLALHQISIFTIDSFFGRLLSGFQHELGLPTRFKAVDDDAPELRQLRLEAIGAVLEQYGDGAVGALLDVLHEGKAQRSIVADLEATLASAYEIFLTSRGSAWDMAAWPGGPELPYPLSEIEAERAVNRLLAGAASFGGFANKIEEDVARFRDANWTKFLTTGIAKAVANGTGIFNRKPVPDELTALYAPLINHASGSLVDGHLKYTAALRAVLELVHAEFNTRCRDGGLMAFRDVPLLLSDFMHSADAGELAHRLDASVDGLLLDEFQDTDPLQYKILKPFADRIERGPAGEGVLFCVGDLKQSIYGWRGAVPEIFDRFGADMESVGWESMDLSYRSSPEVLDAVNAVFSNLSSNPGLCGHANRLYGGSAARDWETRFNAHGTARSEPGYVVLLEAPIADEDSEEDEETGPAPYEFWVADEIRRIWEGTPGRSIGVLLRTNAAARLLAESLNALGVPASSEGGGDLRDDPAVELIVSAFRFADHPGDTAAVCHLLNSPLAAALDLGDGGLKASEMAALVLRRRLGNEGAGPIVAGWARLLAPHCEERGARRLQQLTSLAEAYDRDPGQRPLDFVRFLDSQQAEEASSGGVQVLTIHKSKGLEFDIVILPELHKRLPGPEPALAFGRDPLTHEIDRVTAWPKKELAELIPALGKLRFEYYEREIREALCLLYVALTRARRALHILTPSQPNKKDGTPQFTMASWVKCALIKGEAVPSASGASLLYENGTRQWWSGDEPVSPPARQVRAPVALAGLNFDVWPARVHERVRPSQAKGEGQLGLFEPEPIEVQTEETEIPEREQDILAVDARRRGSALHAMLELVGWSENALPARAELIRHARRKVVGLTMAEAESMIVRLEFALARAEVAAALAKGSYPAETELWRECAIAVYVGEGLEGYVDGRLDRLVVQRKAGVPVKAWVLDFKSDAISRDAVPAAVSRYREQMRIYRQAAARMLGLEIGQVTARLVFLEPGRVVDL